MSTTQSDVSKDGDRVGFKRMSFWAPTLFTLFVVPAVHMLIGDAFDDRLETPA